MQHLSQLPPSRRPKAALRMRIPMAAYPPCACASPMAACPPCACASPTAACPPCACAPLLPAGSAHGGTSSRVSAPARRRHFVAVVARDVRTSAGGGRGLCTNGCWRLSAVSSPPRAAPRHSRPRASGPSAGQRSAACPSALCPALGRDGVPVCPRVPLLGPDMTSLSPLGTLCTVRPGVP